MFAVFKKSSACVVPTVQRERLRMALEAIHYQYISDEEIDKMLDNSQGDAQGAVVNLMNERSWFRRIRPDLIEAKDVKEELLKCKAYFTSPKAVSKKGSLVLFIDATKHMKKDSPMESLIPLVCFIVEECRRRRQNQNQMVTIVIEMKNLKWSRCFDGKTFSKIGEVMAYYEELLDECYIISPPTIFKSMWSIMKSFIDPEARNKIHLMKREDLRKFIDLKFLPKSLKGDLPDVSAETLTREYAL